MKVVTRYKEQKVDASDTVVVIEECIETTHGYRSFDPQSGSRLIFIPEYSVRIYLQGSDRELIVIMDMDEVYEKYPWFFD